MALPRASRSRLTARSGPREAKPTRGSCLWPPLSPLPSTLYRPLYSGVAHTFNLYYVQPNSAKLLSTLHQRVLAQFAIGHRPSFFVFRLIHHISHLQLNLQISLSLFPTQLTMPSRFIILVCLLLCCLLSLSILPSHPVSGSYAGEWGQTKSDRGNKGVKGKQE